MRRFSATEGIDRIADRFITGPRAREEGVVLERGAELSALREEIERAKRGHGRLVTIEGPPGIGKTRLLVEAIRAAGDEGMLALRARADPLERGVAHGVVRQLFEPALRDPRLKAELLSGPAAVAKALFEDHPGDSGSETVGALRTLHGLLWVAINLSEHRPLALAIDDAQWADAPSLRFASYLARRLDGLRALVVVAHRPGGEGGGASVGELTLAPVEHRTLRPAPLSEEATSAMVRDALGEGADPEFCRACHSSSGGNPLLLHELVRAMIARGVEPTADQVEVLAELGQAAVSRTVRVRLAQLPPDATRLAEAAAVLGEDVPLSQAAALAELDPADADRAVEELRRAEILAPGPTIAFVHPLVRDSLRAGLEPLRAERAHAEAARLLREAGARDELIAEQIVRAPPEGADANVQMLRAAGRRAVASGDGPLAASYLRRALAEPPAADELAQVLVELADAEVLFDGPAAVGHFEEALARIEDPVARTPVAARLAAFLPSERPEDAMAIGMEAIEALGDREPGLRRQLLAIVATGGAMLSPKDGLPERLLGAMEAEEGGGDAGAKMIAAVLAYRDVWRNAPLSRALRRAERAFEGDWYAALALGGPFSLGVIALLATESPAAPRAIDEWLAYARRTGEAAQLGGAKMLSAELRLLRGELADAAQDAEDALEAMEAWGMSGVAVAYAAGVLATSALERGELERAARSLERARCSDREAGAPGIHGLLAARARLRAAAGEPRVGFRETLALGRRFAELGGESPALLPWRSRAALLMHSLDEQPEEARALAGEEVELARAWGGGRALGRALTAAASVVGGEEGIALLEEATAALDEVPAPLEQARAHLALGRELHRARSPREARDPLRQALQLAVSCGASPLEEHIRSELLAAGARTRRAALIGPEALSQREERVARLAADGRTNREIASELFVTPRTVETYLSRAYRKLGIRSRAELGDALAPIRSAER